MTAKKTDTQAQEPPAIDPSIKAETPDNSKLYAALAKGINAANPDLKKKVTGGDVMDAAIKENGKYTVILYSFQKYIEISAN